MLFVPLLCASGLRSRPQAPVFVFRVFEVVEFGNTEHYIPPGGIQKELTRPTSDSLCHTRPLSRDADITIVEQRNV